MLFECISFTHTNYLSISNNYWLKENKRKATIWQISHRLSLGIDHGRLSLSIPEHCLLCSYAACLLTCSSCSPTTDLEALEPRKKFNPCCLLTPPPPPLFPPPPSLWHKPRVRHVTPAPAVVICPWSGSMNPVGPLRCLSYLSVKTRRCWYRSADESRHGSKIIRRLELPCVYSFHSNLLTCK